MSDSVWPHRHQPTRLSCPWDSPGKNTEVGCHFLLQCMKVKSESEAAQSFPTLSDPMDCSLPGSSVHGIFQARVLEWGAIAFSKICRWHHPYGRKWRGTKKPLDEIKRGEWKTWLKTQHSKIKIMASSTIHSWQIDGKTMKTVTDFIFLASKHCRWWLQTWN